MDKVIVKFLKGNGVFVAGDITQLPKEEADELLAKKMIEIIDAAYSPVKEELELKNLPPIEADKNICAICGKEFKTQPALKMHKGKAHKIK